MLRNLLGSVFNAMKLRYDAVIPSKRRRNIIVSTKPADRELTIEERQKLLSQAREIQGNFAIVSFLIDKHLQYMATYKFQMKTEYTELNQTIERLFVRWSRRKNCDIAEEFCFSELLQMIEMHRTTDGDVLIVKHGNLKLQLIEGDRVRNPDNIGMRQEWLHGLKRDEYGKTVSYAVSKRLDMGGFEHEKNIPSENAWLLSYRRRIDQRRGVTPLAPAINQMNGLYESFDFALAKERLMQLLGIATLREDADAPLTKTQQKEQEQDDNEFHREILDKFGPEIVHLSMSSGDDIKVIESTNPSQNTQSFWEMMIRQILLSLHIPYSFFDGSKTNYYGAEGELNQYLDSCTNRQIPIIEWLNELTQWLITAWYEDGEISLPEGIKLENVFDGIQWSNSGMPYWVLFRLVKDAYSAMMCGAISPQRFAGMFGMDYEDNVSELAKAIKYAQEKGFRPSFDMTDKENMPNISVNFGG
jgi:capsid protein